MRFSGSVRRLVFEKDADWAGEVYDSVALECEFAGLGVDREDCERVGVCAGGEHPFPMQVDITGPCSANGFDFNNFKFSGCFVGVIDGDRVVTAVARVDKFSVRVDQDF